MRSSLLLLCAGTALLVACNREQPADTASTTSPDAGHAFKAEIDADDFRVMVETLSSDDFEGRAPGSPGGEKTVEYIKAQYERIGLEPGGENGTFYQTVPMVETTADEATVLRLDSNGNARDLAFGADFVIGTRTGKPEINVRDSELVFVGYGVNAPEQGWNDYAGLDVKGKTVVMFVNDPGFHAKDASLFEGNRMTYYGRWTYKFEEAARQGAEAALIIHDTEGASYGWDVVKNSWSGAQFDLRAEDDPDPRLPAQGWITGEVARQLFAESGHDLDAMYVAANKRGFTAVPLQAKVSFDLRSTTAEVLAQRRRLPARQRAPGRDRDLPRPLGPPGQARGHDPANGVDAIYNGAVDNATGVAGIIEIAGKFAAGPRPARSVVFLAVTLEESGLLGSKYYVAQAVVPAGQDGGRDQPRRDERRRAFPRHRGQRPPGSSGSKTCSRRTPMRSNAPLVEEGNPAGGYFRSDHFNFAKAACRRCTPRAAATCWKAAPRPARRRTRNTRRYHQPATRSTTAGAGTASSKTCRRCTASATTSPPARVGPTGTREQPVQGRARRMRAGREACND